jgi:hypothetical protein
MRTVFRQATRDERVTIQHGTFDQTGVKDGWADVIFIATVSGDFVFAGSSMFEPFCVGASLVPWLRAGSIRIFKNTKSERLHLSSLCLLGWVSVKTKLTFIAQSHSVSSHRVRWTNKINILDERFAKEPGFFSWRKIYEASSFKQNFRLIKEQELQYDLVGTVESLKNHAKCWTPIAILSDTERKEVMRDLELIIESADDGEREWIDKSRGVLRVPYDAVIPVIQKM